MKKQITFFLALVLLVLTSWAQTSFVSTLGASSGWYSDDTRTSAGATLNGLVSSYPPYFGGAPGTSINDAAIAAQIIFGNMYTGSTDGFGVLQLDGTTANTGKSSVKYYNPSGIAPGSALASFTSTFRWYMDPYATSRTVGLSLMVVGSNSVVYSLAYVGEGAAMNSWNTFTVNASTTPSSPGYGWFVYGTGAPAGTQSQSLNAWLSDPTWGPILSGGTIVAQGFNIGSYQKNCRVGIDWLESSILNSGNRIDFVAQIPTVHNTTQNTYFLNIQAAITAANENDVIEVAAGTYTEAITITKAITLNGPNATIAGNGSRVPEAVIQFPVGAADETGLIYVGTNLSGVTIAGFDLKCQDATITSGLFGHYLILTEKVNNLTIRNNRMYSSVIPMYILWSKAIMLIAGHMLTALTTAVSTFRLLPVPSKTTSL